MLAGSGGAARNYAPRHFGLFYSYSQRACRVKSCVIQVCVIQASQPRERLARRNLYARQSQPASTVSLS